MRDVLRPLDPSRKHLRRAHDPTSRSASHAPLEGNVFPKLVRQQCIFPRCNCVLHRQHSYLLLLLLLIFIMNLYIYIYIYIYRERERERERERDAERVPLLYGIPLRKDKISRGPSLLDARSVFINVKAPTFEARVSNHTITSRLDLPNPSHFEPPCPASSRARQEE